MNGYTLIFPLKLTLGEGWWCSAWFNCRLLIHYKNQLLLHSSVTTLAQQYLHVVETHSPVDYLLQLNTCFWFWQIKCWGELAMKKKFPSITLSWLSIWGQPVIHFRESKRADLSISSIYSWLDKLFHETEWTHHYHNDNKKEKSRPIMAKVATAGRRRHFFWGQLKKMLKLFKRDCQSLPTGG